MDFHEFRRNGIGGSDIASLFGISKYKSRYELYLEKIDEKKHTEDSLITLSGKALESVILNKYDETYGTTIQRNIQIIHEEFPYLRANLDGLDNDAVVEAKSVFNQSKEEDYRWGEAGTDQIPLPYLLQVAYYCYLAKKEKAIIAVLFNGTYYQEYIYTRNNALEIQILKEAHEFWTQHVLKKNPPEPETYEDCKSAFSHIENVTEMVANDIQLQLLEQFDIATHEIKCNEKLIDEIRFSLANSLQFNDCIKSSEGKVLATFRGSKNNKRTLRIYRNNIGGNRHAIHKQFT